MDYLGNKILWIVIVGLLQKYFFVDTIGHLLKIGDELHPYTIHKHAADMFLATTEGAIS